jgi:Zn-dependent peptidase ImmA (M78 family)
VAHEVRQRLSLGEAPVRDLGAVCERLGLHTFSTSLGAAGPDGGCIEVGDVALGLGAAVINGDAPAGRRRMTLTHELGHWLSGDAYDLQASSDSERMINSFAIHFLAPRAGIQAVWDQYGDLPVRDRALAIGASFRLSWSAAIAQLKNVGLVSDGEYRYLNEYEPRSGDYLRLGLSWDEELRSPYVSPGFAAACLNGYVSGRLTGDRVIELLRGTLAAGDLPHQDPPSRDSLRTAFAGHGD